MIDFTLQVANPAGLHGALDVLLQQSGIVRRSFSAGRPLAQLLLVCKTWHVAVKSNCLGCIPLSLDVEFWEKKEEYVCWIGSYGQLLSVLDLPWFYAKTKDQLSAFSQALEAALANAAAATPAGLQLQKLCSPVIPITGSMLRLVSPLCLSCLRVKLCEDGLIGLPGAVSQLTNLRELDLSTDSQPLNSVLPSLSHLTLLTKLHLTPLSPGALLTCVPAQVRDLGACMVQSSRVAGQPLTLGHLTAVTELRLQDLHERDQLPRNIEDLRLDDCSALQPLRQLRNLATFRMDESTMAADQLRQLPTVISTLASVELGYTRVAAAAAAAGAWPCLPGLRNLVLHDLSGAPDELPRATVQHLAALTALTQLLLGGSNEVPCEATAGELARALAGLTNLATLMLNLNLEDEAAEAEELAVAIAGCQGLGMLRVEGIDFGLSITHMTKLRALYDLRIADMTLSDLAVNALVYSMTQLEELQLSFCPMLTGSFMPVLAGLPMLTELYLPGAAVTDATLVFLHNCDELRVLEIWGASEASDEGIAALKAALPELYVATV